MPSSRSPAGATCYSAQIISDYRKYVRVWGADIDLATYKRLYFDRKHFPTIKTPKVMDAAFANPQSDDEREIGAMIDAYNADQTAKLEQEVFAQRKRVVEAERALQAKVTKKAQEHVRIGSSKVKAAMSRLSAIGRTQLTDEDRRIYPGWYAPVMVFENGRYVVKPMRFRYRFPSWNDAIERQKDGSYNARMDNLPTVWKNAFGVRHGILLANRFYEHVWRHAVEKRELKPDEKPEDVVIEFNASTLEDMNIACLWTPGRRDDGGEMYSFAAITTDPPPEIAEVGHDRCIIPIKAENVDAWMRPDPANLAECYAILEDRERPYYEHRLAA
jgi:putative SOS response-associated peptidase YedK